MESKEKRGKEGENQIIQIYAEIMKRYQQLIESGNGALKTFSNWKEKGKESLYSMIIS